MENKTSDKLPRGWRDNVGDGWSKILNAMLEEEEKYYTPTIEEFHVGFECEIKNSSDEPFEWEPIIVGIEGVGHYNDIWSFEFSDYSQAVEDKSIRVKYLDKEDIDSLGFGGYIAPHEYDHTWWRTADIILKAWFNHDEPIVRIMHVPNTIIFHGTIKNKSELKVLLKQLGIE